jgi:hypothetical protein
MTIAEARRAPPASPVPSRSSKGRAYPGPQPIFRSGTPGITMDLNPATLIQHF